MRTRDETGFRRTEGSGLKGMRTGTKGSLLQDVERAAIAITIPIAIMDEATSLREAMPQELLLLVREEEPKRFRAATRALERMERTEPRDRDKHAAANLARTFRVFLGCKWKQDAQDVVKLVQVGIRFICSIQDSMLLQEMWVDVVSSYLKRYKHDVELVIEWRPLYEQFHKKHLCPTDGCYVGLTTKLSHASSWVTLLKRCRRFFPQGAHVEIWNEIAPMLEDLYRSDIFGGLILTACLFPYRKANIECTLVQFDWNELLRVWCGLAFQLPKCSAWKSGWLMMIAKLAKHGGQYLKWDEYLPRLFSTFLHYFELPLGNADGRCPLAISPPIDRRNLIACVLPGPRTNSIAKFIIYTIDENNSVETNLNQMVVYLEQFSHPSNTGQWSSKIANLIGDLMYFAGKRQQDVHVGRVSLSDSLENRVFAAITRLASRAQFSKSRTLSRTAGEALATAAFLCPKGTLGLARSQFVEAFESSTAGTHLAEAITTLAYCVRPMLLAADEGTDIAIVEEDYSDLTSSMDSLSIDCKVEQSQACAQTWLASAVGSVITGIDANDGPKTLATFKFFTAVFSSLASIENFPLDWETWSDAVLAQVFSILSTMDLPAEAGQNGSSSFLSTPSSEYFNFCRLFYLRLPKDAVRACLCHLRRFLMQEPLSSMADEVGALLAGAVRVLPAEASVEVLCPLSKLAIGILSSGSNASADAQELSRSAENSASFYLTVLAMGIVFAGKDGILPHIDLYENLAMEGLQSSSRIVREAAADFFAALIHSLTHPKVCVKTEDCFGGRDHSCLTSKWFAKDFPLSHLSWYVPGTEEFQGASHLLNLHLKSALCQLEEFISSDVTPERSMKMRVLQSLHQIDAIGAGVSFTISGQEKDYEDLGEKLYPVGMPMVSFVSASIIEELMLALTRLSSWLRKNEGRLNGDSAELLAAVVSVSSTVLFPWVIDARTVNLLGPMKSRVDKVLLSHFDHSSAERKKLKPLWLLADEAQRLFDRRESMSRERSWMREHSLRQHSNWNGMVPLLGELYELSLHTYRSVSEPARAVLKRSYDEYPNFINLVMPSILRNLMDPNGLEDNIKQAHSAAKAASSCSLLSAPAIAQYLVFEPSLAVELSLTLLDCEKHDDVETQNKVMMCFFSLVANIDGTVWSRDGRCGSEFVRHLCHLRLKAEKFLLHTQSTSHSLVHWRYMVMCNALLSVTVPSHSDQAAVVEEATRLASHFCNVLVETDLPILRHVVLGGLQLLLGQGVPGNAFETAVGAAVQDRLSVPGSLASMVCGLAHAHPSPQAGNDYLHAWEAFNSGKSVPAMYTTDLLGKFLLSIVVWPSWHCYKMVPKSGICVPYIRFFARIASLGHGALCQDLLGVASAIWENAMRKDENGLPAAEDKLMRVTASEVVGGLVNSSGCQIDTVEQGAMWLVTAATESAVGVFEATLAAMRFAVDGNATLSPEVRSIVTGTVLKALRDSSNSSSTSLALSRCLDVAHAIVSQLPSPDFLDGFKCQVLRACLKLAQNPSATVRTAAATTAAAICEGVLQRPSALFLGSYIEPASGFEIVATAIQEGRSFLKEIELEGKASCAKFLTSKDQFSDEDSSTLKWLEFSIHFLLAITKSDLSIELEYFMVQALPLALKALILGERHRDLTLTATQAIAYAKYVDLSPEPRALAAATLASLSNDAVWQVQVAAILAGAYFAFRHVFLLGPGEWSLLRGAVLNCLQDKKPEVHKCAQEALSGLLRSYSVSEAESLRGELCSNLNTPDMNTRRAAVLGVGAFLLSSPYEVPDWLPPLLVELAGVASKKQPSLSVRDAATQAIASFRRTHTEVRSDLKRHFSEEQWEAVAAAAPHTHSYFA